MRHIRSELLLHPLFLAALVTLLLNDWVFKSAWPGLLTGKLSDFAGLIVAPVFICAVLGLRSRRGVWVVHGGVGLVFAFLQLVPVEVWHPFVAGVVPRPRLWADPTDLIALAALPWSARFVMEPRVAHSSLPSPVRAIAAGSVLIVASFAIVATSRIPPAVTDKSEVLVVAEGEEAALEVFERALRHVLTSPWATEDFTTHRYKGRYLARVYSSGSQEASSEQLEIDVYLWVGWDAASQTLRLAEVGFGAAHGYPYPRLSLLKRIRDDRLLPSLRSAIEAEEKSVLNQR
jgi:hypothetical protein